MSLSLAFSANALIYAHIHSHEATQAAAQEHFDNIGRLPSLNYKIRGRGVIKAEFANYALFSWRVALINHAGSWG